MNKKGLGAMEIIGDILIGVIIVGLIIVIFILPAKDKGEQVGKIASCSVNILPDTNGTCKAKGACLPEEKAFDYGCDSTPETPVCCIAIN